jgi:sugar phosphate isomerase/epimerase
MPGGLALPRRSLLPLLTALALPAEAAAQASPRWVPGLQLWSVRDPLGTDRDGTLRRVAEVGYRSVEPAGLAGVTPHEMRASLQRHGLAAPSIHASFERLERDLDTVVDEAQVLGAEFLVCPSIDAGRRATADDWKRACHVLARTAREVRRRGLSLAYHNHDFEFVPLPDGSIPLDLMMRETDPGEVKLELDVYWLAKAGRDPVQSLRDSRGRVALVHLKDLGADGATVELGHGVLDMEAIIRAALAVGVRHLFVEQDDSADPLASVRTSYGFLQGLSRDARPG